jgi:hypothetical protein
MAATLTKYEITDLDSFREVTANPREIAALYFYSVLDCLVELAYKVSHDFFKRPHLYVDLAESPPKGQASKAATTSTQLPPILAKLHAEYGTSEFLPSAQQRDEIFMPIFGRGAHYWGDEEGDFPRLRDELLNAAAAFAERVFDTGVQMLVERVRTTHRPFKEYLRGLEGDSVSWSREEALPQLEDQFSYTILRNRGVASVFGIHKPPIEKWPYTEDSNGDKLVEAISKQLRWGDQPDEVAITREQFSNLQRAALRGAEAIAAIIDFTEKEASDKGDAEEVDDDVRRLIRKCYTWAAALLSLTSRTKTEQVAPGMRDSKLTMGHTAIYSPVSR